MKPSEASEQTIFDGARQMPDAQARASYLEAACAGDPKLRERVENLLKASLRADQFLAGHPLELGEAARQTMPIGPLSEGPGTIIDKYKLLEKLGEGGFGVVYMAEQKQPVKRRVALKIIKIGMHRRIVSTLALTPALSPMERVSGGGIHGKWAPRKCRRISRIWRWRATWRWRRSGRR